MAEERTNTDPMRPATVGLRGGETALGRIAKFSPLAPTLELAIHRQALGVSIKGENVSVPMGDVAFVAFHRRAGQPGRPRSPALREFQVQMVGRRVFQVVADPIRVDDPLGFWAWPLGDTGIYDEMYFFRKSLDRVEDKEPLGSMLVRSGALAPGGLEPALATQNADRNIRLGDILVRDNVVPPEEIERAAKAQAEAAPNKPMRLGEFLVEAGLATDADITRALEEQRKKKGRRLGQILVDLGIVDEVTVCKTLGRKFHMAFVDLDVIPIPREVADEIPEQVIRRYRVLPIKSDERTITIAISDPMALEAIDMLRFSTKKQIVDVVATITQLDEHIDAIFGKPAEEGGMEDILRGMEAGASGAVKKGPEPDELSLASSEESELAILVNRIFVDAYRRGASDIHIEPTADGREVLVRFRIDGQCVEYHRLPGGIRREIVARIKVLATLDITEHRKPQDGKIRFAIGTKTLELRVACLPTVGENEDVVLRLLAGAGALPLEQLRLTEANLAAVRLLIRQPYGLILAVGPTGSGKTTTLHALLGAVNDSQRKIWTAEDPVEITQPGLRQVQMHAKIGLTFATAMRAFLRADPDIIMVGEMRDLETASTAIEASLTGHLVFSTLHTNNAPETVTRLVDMGLDPFTFSDSLRGVLAQRLARGLCPACRREIRPSETLAGEFTQAYGAEALERRLAGTRLTLWEAPGCKTCDGKGYKGRMAIHELLVADDDIRREIQRKGTAEAIRDVARRRGMRTLMEDGLEKVLSGDTDLKQVLTVCSR
jgi:type II secretory ATPase GspE/PulE/Tfp pilus assembly ATPase PilB-like protein